MGNSSLASWAPAIIIGVLVLLIIGWAIAVYNRLVTKRNSSTESLQGIDIVLENRFDQIKAQADAVAGVVKKEVDLILGSTSLRTGRTIEQLSVSEKTELNTAMDDAQQKIVAEAGKPQGLGSGPGALASLENYPEMKTTQNVELLQRTINETEERLQAARRVYNRAATDYNTSRQVFPTVIIARLLGFGGHDLFELSDQRKRNQYDLEGFLES